MSNKLFVGNLSWNVTEEDLRAEFGQYGNVEDAKVITDRETGRSRGFGFVSFADASSAKQAIDGSNGKELKGRALRVNLAQEKERTGGGGGGYGGGRGGRSRT